MQIFKTSSNLAICAKNLDDKRLNKIILESAQIATTGLWLNDCSKAEILCSMGLIYFPSHEHHPLCEWCSKNNFHLFIVTCYGLALCLEYQYRFKKRHKVQNILINLLSINIKNKEKTSPQPNCSIHFKHLPLHNAYKAELVFKWNRDAIKPKWTNRKIPEFYINYLKEK